MSTAALDREALVAALNASLREVSGQGAIFSQAVAARLGINGTDLECLSHIAQGPLTAGALAAATGLTNGAVTGVVDRLGRAGLARRELDPGDRRRVFVHPSAAVKDRVTPLLQSMERHACAALAAYEDKELALILDFLQRIRGASLAATADLTATESRDNAVRAHGEQ